MKDITTITRTIEVNNPVAIKEAIKDMWRDSFAPGDEWLDMYFNNVYRPEDVVFMTAADDDDVIASSLLLQRYMLYFHSMPVPMGYISGATTLPEYRERGYMKDLMKRALEEAYDRGDAIVSLIPASRSLYFYYDKLGFSTVFYIDEERYTALHHFAYDGKYSTVDASSSKEVFRTVDELLRENDNVVLHSYDDFQNILQDVILDGGQTIALRDENTGQIAAVVMAVANNDSVTVRELIARTPDAANAALEYIRNQYPDKPMTVIVRPGNRNVPVHARGMARIVNTRKLLEAYAARYPKLKMNIRVYDSVLPQNSHIYIIDRGEAVINDGFGGNIDLDVTQEVLLSILCSDKRIGTIFNMPTARPYISMMMD